MTESPPSSGQSLCQSCGLCCDGSFFYHTPTGDLNSQNEGTIDFEDETIMPQPCVHHGCPSECAIYHTRPDVCRTFKCGLLKDLEENNCTRSEALRVVERLITLREKLLTPVKTNHKKNESQPLFVQLNRFQVLQQQHHALNVSDHAEWFLDCIEFIQLVRKRLLPDFMKEEKDEQESTTSS